MEQGDPRAALDRLVTAGGESYTALSRLIGRNAAYLQQYVRRGSPRLLAERDRRLLAAYFGVEEGMLGAPDGRRPEAFMVRVARIDVAASAGPGGFVEDDRPAGHGEFDPRLLRALGVSAADLSVIRAAGDSMLPTIADGDEILVDRDDRRVTAKGGIFVIRLDDALMVKRLQRRGGGISVTSDNPAYPAIDPDGAIDVIGRVVWLARTLK